MSKPEIKLIGLQIKNLEKARRLAEALEIIEEECGIKETKISLDDVFICPWMDTHALDCTEMEVLLKGIIEGSK